MAPVPPSREAADTPRVEVGRLSLIRPCPGWFPPGSCWVPARDQAKGTTGCWYGHQEEFCPCPERVSLPGAVSSSGKWLEEHCLPHRPVWLQVTGGSC